MSDVAQEAEARAGLAPAQWIVLGAAVAAAVGSFLPWVTVSSAFGSASKSGLDGDGAITLVLAIGLGVLAGLRKLPVLALIAALAIAGVGVVDVVDVYGTESIVGVEPSVGVGLWLVLAAGVVGAVGAGQELRAT